VIKPAQGFGLNGRSIFRALLGLLPVSFENFRQSGDEIFQPGGEVGLTSAKVVVVMGMGGQGPVVALQVAGIVLLQGKKAAQTIAAFMEYEGRQQASRAAVAVVVGMDGHEQVVD
jgi:hypothetical protein